LYAWIETIDAEEDWERINRLLSFIYEHLSYTLETSQHPEVLRYTIQEFLQLCQQYLQYLDTDIYEIQLQTFLPMSFDIYSQFLLEQENYREWAELFFPFHKNPLHDKEAIKLVEKKHRKTL